MPKQPSRAARLLALSLACAGSCSHPLPAAHNTPTEPEPRAATRSTPGNAPTARPYTAPAQRLARDQLNARLPSPGTRLAADDFLHRHAVAFNPAQPADADHADGMRAIQSRRFALQPAELDRLRAQGFVVSGRQTFPNFMTGYAMLYIADQPVYLSADAMLNALHASFDTMVADVETDALAPALVSALAGLRTSLAGPSGAALTAETRADLDVYLSVALSLLQGHAAVPVAGGRGADVDAIVNPALRGEGTAHVALFGDDRDVDFSQFRPRGHYAGVPAREQYFRAMMWLGREGMRLTDVANDGRRTPRRRAIAAAVGLHALQTPATRAAFEALDNAVSAFAGEPEALTVREADALAAAITRAGGLARASDSSLLDALDTLRGDRPRVATTLLHHPDGVPGAAPEPLALSLSPQRYTPDALVLSRVSYDRVDNGRVFRMMPDPLDAAFGALGNDQAAALLAPSLARYDYATELETSRDLVDAHEASYWNGSMYAAWLGALRALSPRETLADSNTLPTVMTSEAWGRRVLGTQLAAWSELRHDLVLYTAQSYSAEPGCSYPDAYVDPYPAFWDALGQWVGRGRALVAGVPWSAPATRAKWEAWLNRADDAVHKLGDIARRERDGQSLTPEQLAYVNQAVTARQVNVVCTTVTRVDAGWYYDLFEPRLDLGDERTVVADVHTQPADEAGNRVGNVLHVGTGRPEVMVVLVGPPEHQRAYAGLVSTYLERVTGNFERLTDQQWRQQIAQARAPGWLAGVVVGGAVNTP